MERTAQGGAACASGRPAVGLRRGEAGRPRHAGAGRLRYRLLHSSGDVVIADRAVALGRMADLPGAKLFVLRGD